MSFSSSKEATVVVAPRQHLLEFLRRGAGWSFAHGFLARFLVVDGVFEVGARDRPRAPPILSRRLSSELGPKSTPAELQPSSMLIEGTPGTGWSVIELLAGVDAVRLLAGLDVVGDCLDAIGGHQQRILLRSGADDAVLDPLARPAAAVDGDDDTPFSLPAALSAA